MEARPIHRSCSGEKKTPMNLLHNSGILRRGRSSAPWLGVDPMRLSAQILFELSQLSSPSLRAWQAAEASKDTQGPHLHLANGV